MLSEKYGWLPSQIRNERVDDVVAYIDIVSMKNLIEKNELKKNGRH